MTDKFKITGAVARSKTEFSVGLNILPLNAEDPYTIFLSYDGSKTQPWARSDANRNLSDLTDLKGTYFGLSDEEFAYRLDEDGLNSEKIKGMGIYADDATEGAGNIITNIDGTPYIVGQRRQYYKRSGDGVWMKMSTQELVPGKNQKDIDFEGIDGLSKDAIFLCGQTVTEDYFTPDDLEEKMNAALENDDDDEYDRIDALIEARRPKPEGRAYHWDGSYWTQIDVEDYFPKTVFVDSKGRTWLGCNQGTVLQVERDEDGEFDVDDIEIIEDSRTDIYSITEFKGRLILASAEGLFAYDENFDSLDDEIVRIKPKLNKALGPRPSPLKVQAVDDVMFYFDYNLGIYIWDGDKAWTNIPIPPEFLERDFKGLKP